MENVCLSQPVDVAATGLPQATSLAGPAPWTPSLFRGSPVERPSPRLVQRVDACVGTTPIRPPCGTPSPSSTLNVAAPPFVPLLPLRTGRAPLFQRITERRGDEAFVDVPSLDIPDHLRNLGSRRRARASRRLSITGRLTTPLPSGVLPHHGSGSDGTASGGDPASDDFSTQASGGAVAVGGPGVSAFLPRSCVGRSASRLRSRAP